MGNNLEHLLSRHKVIISFSIGRQLDADNIKKLTEKIKAVSKNKSDFNSRLRDEIQKETTNLIFEGKIPGLIANGIIGKLQDSSTKPKTLLYNVDKKKLADLYAITSAVNADILENEFNKNDMCFIIYTIRNFLNVTDEDFKKFYEALKSPNDASPSNNETDEEDDDKEESDE